ncbi:hypothetical protein GQ54DRAFT_296208 [Martensiomyces pterosporus]|nr:hypothetical protein GQ54DRAFT_296208 [Martensiomyces pterosporus]
MAADSHHEPITPVGDDAEAQAAVVSPRRTAKDQHRGAESMADSFLKSMGQTLKRDAEARTGRQGEGRRPSQSPRGEPASSSRQRSRSARRGYDYDHESRYRDHDYHRRSRDRSRSRSRTYRRRSRSRGGRSHSRHRRRSRDRSSTSRRSRDVVPLHLRPKKLSAWDQAPPGFESIQALDAKASGLFPPPGQAVGSRNVASFNPSVLFEHTHREENDRFRPSSRGEKEFPSTASRQARRLYVGNIPYGINEDSIASFFNNLMVQLNIAPQDELPVLNIQINYDKNYAFVEFRDPEQATMGMGLDGVAFQNQKLKIRRPKDYIPPPGQTSEPRPPVLNIPGMLSNTVPDSPNKIYVGGLPTYLNEDQVMELLRAFGELKAFNLVKDSATHQSRGFAFCEYVDPNLTDVACQGLNGMELGDRHLIVQRASIGARSAQQNMQQNMQQNTRAPHGQYSQQQQQYRPLQEMGGGYNSNNTYQSMAQGYAPPHGSQAQGQYGHPQQQQTYSHPPPSYVPHSNSVPPSLAPAVNALASAGEAQPTPIVQLLNMVTRNELADPEEYEDITEDVREECAKHGVIVELAIPRPNPDQPDAEVPGVGKILIKYASAAEATVALNALAGRRFADRTVIASYMSEDDFANRNY